MQPNAVLRLCLPGEDEREHWQKGPAQAWEKLTGPPTGGSPVFAIEVLALDSMPFWALSPADGVLDLESVVALRWEALGLHDDGDGQPWAHWRAGEAQGRVLAGNVGLAADVQGESWQNALPTRFEISPRLYPIPHHEAVVWRELGRYVVAFNRGDQLVHFTALTARHLDADAALEIRDTAHALEAHELINELRGIRVWTDAAPAFAKALHDLLKVRVREEAKPAPMLPDAPCTLFPPVVARACHERERRNRNVRVLMALATLYVMVFGVWSGFLLWKEKQLNHEEARLAQSRPEVEAVRQQQARWLALAAATDPDSYPAEIFHRLVALLPHEGIQFEAFDLKSGGVIVSGKASSVNHAMKFKADLTSSEDLKQFAWSFPQPVILDDNRASFSAEGTIAGGGAHEGQ